MLTNTALSLILTNGQNPNDTYTATANAVSDMVNKIGLQIFYGMSDLDSKTGRFDKSFENGDTIETLYVGITAGQEFDLTNDNPFTIARPTTKAEYHKQSKHLQYPITLDNKEVNKALMGGKTVGDYTAEILRQMNNGVELDKFNAFKLFWFQTGQGATYDVAVGTYTTPGVGTIYDHFGKVVAYPIATYPTATNANQLALATQMLKDINENSKALTFASTGFNAASVDQMTPTSDQILVISSLAMQIIDEQILSTTFHDGKRKIVIPAENIIEVDQLVDTTTVPEDGEYIFSPLWAIFDKKHYAQYNTTARAASIVNPANDTTNYFLDLQPTRSYPTAANAVLGLYSGTVGA